MCTLARQGFSRDCPRARRPPLWCLPCTPTGCAELTERLFQRFLSGDWQKEVGADGVMTTEVDICEDDDASYSDEHAHEAFGMLTRYVYYGDSGV